jgi:hypothetical protein
MNEDIVRRIEETEEQSKAELVQLESAMMAKCPQLLFAPLNMHNIKLDDGGIQFGNNLDTISELEKSENERFEINPKLKERFYAALHAKDHKRHFQVVYIFKEKIKRMYRIDCMTRKINV